MLAAGAPIDGIGLQSHFDSNLTPPSRVLELIDQFAAFGKDLQVTEFDVSVADEQVQADYTRDFLTVCFSHPAMKGFMIWGFWEGAHWKPSAAMIRRDWSTKPNYDAWNDLIYRQWWTDARGVTGCRWRVPHPRLPGRLRQSKSPSTARPGPTRSPSRRIPSRPSSISANPPPARSRRAAWSTPPAFAAAALAPGEIVTIFGSGFGPAALAAAQYADGQLPTSVGETRVLFDGVAAPMIYAVAGQVSAIVPYSVKRDAQVQVEYQGIATPALSRAGGRRRAGHLRLSQQALRRAGDQRQRRRRPSPATAISSRRLPAPS